MALLDGFRDAGAALSRFTERPRRDPATPTPARVDAVLPEPPPLPSRAPGPPAGSKPSRDRDGQHCFAIPSWP